MKTIKRMLLGFLMRSFYNSLRIDYKKIDKKAFEEWAYESFDSQGFKSYFAYEDLKILKSLGTPKPDYEYWILIGRRIQLLYLADEMRKAVENRVANEQKKQSQATSGIDKP